MVLYFLRRFVGQAYGLGHFAQAYLGKVLLFGKMKELLLYRVHIQIITYKTGKGNISLILDKRPGMVYTFQAADNGIVLYKERFSVKTTRHALVGLVM